MGEPCYRTKDAIDMDCTSTRIQIWPHNIWESVGKRIRNTEETEPGKESIVELKKALMMTPALGLPDLTKPFELFVHERQHLALGVLAQRLGSWKRPVGYFSKQLNNVSKGWPGCLCAVAATILLIHEARELTKVQKIMVYIPHMVVTVLKQKGGHWLSPSKMLKYQVVLLEQDDVELKTTTIVNPEMFLSTKNPTKKSRTRLPANC